MKREIEFRGKRVDNGEWVYGNLFQTEKWANILTVTNSANEKSVEYEQYKVIPETVGQYVGIKDKNGKKVFVGDIVWGDTIEGDWHKGVVEYNEDMGQYFVNAKNFMQYEKNSDSWSMLGCWTVEGNIFDKGCDNGD